MTNHFVRQFNLPWHQYSNYWISLYAKGDEFPEPVLRTLQHAGLTPLPDGAMGMQTPSDWKSAWEQLCVRLKVVHGLSDIEVALTAGDAPPDGQAVMERKSPEAVQAVADSLWLGNALLEDRLGCYLQPIVSGKDSVFGYESFARIQTQDGAVIEADKIIAASKALNIDHMIDRHLQMQAIKTFVAGKLDGVLFINFFPGFIHRPAVYLEGLSEAARYYDVSPEYIVLEFTKSEIPRDIEHIKNICDYSRSRGYSIALDDIESASAVHKLVPEIHPDFVKLDTHLVKRAAEPAKRRVIRDIVALVHAHDGKVIGEGVETEEMHQHLVQLGVDLFQGYLFSPPVAVEAA